jgi:serine O-acetyltransferase
MKRMGIEETEEEPPALDSCEIISTAEELQKLNKEQGENDKTFE